MAIKIFQKIKNKKAFTLTETIVMITIILILTGIIIVATEDSRALARDKKRIAHFAAYQNALARYYSYRGNKNFPHPDTSECPNFKIENCITRSENCDCGDCKYIPDQNDPSNLDKGIFSCPVRQNNNGGILQVLINPKNPQEKPYLDQLLFDPKDDENHWYSYNVDYKGRNYKLAVLLEKDEQAMVNDGGTCPGTYCPPNFDKLYEVYSTLGAHLAFGYWGITGKSVLSCKVISGTNCSSFSSKAEPVLRLSSTSNAHAALVSSRSYTNTLCCELPAGLVIQEKDCSPGEICTRILTLSANTNAHVGNNYSNYFVSFKRSGGSVSCSIKNNCASDEACLVSISGTTNAHIGNCEAYSNKVCCKASSSF